MTNLIRICLNASLPSLLLLFAATSSAAEGGHSGNGGNALVCFDDPAIAKKLNQSGVVVSKPVPDAYLRSIVSIEALELAEAREGLHGDSALSLLALPANGDLATIASERIRAKIPELGQAVQTGKELIGNRISHVSKPVLIPAADIAPLVYPRDGCVYTTIVRQEALGDGSMRKIAIDDRLFLHARHSRFSRETLLIHEYLLAYMTFNFRDQTSENTRAIVARMLARDVAYPELEELLGASGFKLAHTTVAPRADAATCAAMKAEQRKHQDDSNRFLIKSSDYSVAIALYLDAYDYGEMLKPLEKLIIAAAREDAAGDASNATQAKLSLILIAQKTIEATRMGKAAGDKFSAMITGERQVRAISYREQSLADEMLRKRTQLRCPLN